MESSRETRSKYLSVIIPVYNEEESIPHLHERIRHVLTQQHYSYEIIYVDDGSQDGTFAQLEQLVKNDEHVQVVRLRRNFGQTAAMAAGVAQSSGEILVFMDGDLQNDPIDIPRLLARIEEGYDVVSGWRKERQDAQLSRKLPSMLANKLIAKVTGVDLHDYGCTLKAYRYEVFQHLRLYGEMHRFLPAYAALIGASISELEVTHHARQFGTSKYGISRVVRVVLDLLTLKFLGSFATRPLHAFGIVGLTSLGLGALTVTARLGQSMLPVRTYRPQRATLPSVFPFISFGLLSIMLGLLSEVLTRTHHEAQNKSIYVIKQILTHDIPASIQTDQHSHGQQTRFGASPIKDPKARQNGKPEIVPSH